MLVKLNEKLQEALKDDHSKLNARLGQLEEEVRDQMEEGVPASSKPVVNRSRNKRERERETKSEDAGTESKAAEGEQERG